MRHAFQPDETPLRIQTPCPKRWEELSGSGAKRFCSECSLHVHDAAQLTKADAQALVANATERVCMRLEHDERGAPVFLDSPREHAAAPKLLSFARWALATSAGLLAACRGGDATLPQGAQNPAPDTSRMGKIAAPTLGEVALPTPHEVLGSAGPVGPTPQRPNEELGDVARPAPPSADPR